MKLKLYFSFFLLTSCFGSQAQIGIIYPNGPLYDSSTTYTFATGDSLTHILRGGFMSFQVVVDTDSAVVWQIGTTLKPVFSNDTTACRGIMTDTVHPYPKNANSYFVLKIPTGVPNFIVDFWHRYQTDSFHAGGIVEFSTDNGATWVNTATCSSVNWQNMYRAADTLFSGDAAFTGSSNGEQLSRIQFLNCLPVRPTATNCAVWETLSGPIYFRFRFVSDTTNDSLSGWMIDSIRVEDPGCALGGVRPLAAPVSVTIYPNPAGEQLTINIADAQPFRISLTDAMGRTVYASGSTNGRQTIGTAGWQAGVYFAEIVTSGGDLLTRQVLIQH